jgi:hypothetical protein
MGKYLSTTGKPYSDTQQMAQREAEQGLLSNENISSARAFLQDTYDLQTGKFASNDKAKEVQSATKGLSPQMLITLMSMLQSSNTRPSPMKITPAVASPGLRFAETDPYERFRRLKKKID